MKTKTGFNRFSRLIAALLAAVMTCGIIIACGKPGDKPKSTTDDVSKDTEAGAPALPDLDLDGAEWKVFAVMGEVNGSFYVEEPESEIVSEAVYRTMTNVEDRFTCDIVVVDSGFVAGDHAQAFKTMVDSGEREYSLVELHDAIGTNTALEGYFANIYDVPYLTLTTPWWHGVEDLTVNGKAFMVDTDMSTVSLKNAWMIFFNKDIMDDLKLEYPYQTVLDGNWTLDELGRLTKDVYADLNHNNQVDAGSGADGDMFGFHCMESMYAWFDSFDVATIVKEDDGSLSVTNDITRIQNIVDSMYDLLRNSTGARTSGTYNFVDATGFINGRYMMFHHALVDASDVFRYEEDLNYGIIPSPKYDENQKNYYTSCLTYPFWIPSNLTEKQYETAGAIIEALSYEGYRNTIPAYYERALKHKYSPDDESSKMIEIIHDGLRASFSWCYGNFGEVFYFTLAHMFEEGNTNFQSYYDSHIGAANQRIAYINERLGNWK